MQGLFPAFKSLYNYADSQEQADFYQIHLNVDFNPTALSRSGKGHANNINKRAAFGFRRSCFDYLPISSFIEVCTLQRDRLSSAF